MHRPLSMQCSDGHRQFPEDSSGFAFKQSTAFNEVVEKFSASAEFSDQPDMAFGCDDLVHMQDVLVVEKSMVVYLSRKLRSERFGYFLNGASCTGQPMGGDMHRPIGA